MANDAEEEFSPLSDKNEICQAVNNNTPVAFFDHVWQNGECRRETRVSVGEYIDVGTLGPTNVGWSMDCLLHIGSVKVQRGFLNLGE